MSEQRPNFPKRLLSGLPTLFFWGVMLLLTILLVMAIRGSPGSDQIAERVIPPRVTATLPVPQPSATPPPPPETQSPDPTSIPAIETTRLTPFPIPATPPTRTPVVAHVHGAFALLATSVPLGGTPLAILSDRNRLSDHDLLFVAQEGEVVSLNSRDPLSPQVTGRVLIPAGEPGRPPFLTLAEHRLYVAQGAAGMDILSIEDPAAMSLIGHYDPEAVSILTDPLVLFPQRISEILTVNNDAAYLLVEYCSEDCEPGESVSVLQAVDVSAPAQGHLLDNLILESEGVAGEMDNGFIYLGLSTGVVQTVDARNPAQLSAVGNLQLRRGDGQPPGPVDSLQASGDTLYVVSDGQVWLLDITDRAAPALMVEQPGSGPHPVATQYASAYDGAQFLNDLALFLDGRHGGLRLVDVSDVRTARDLGAYGPAWGLPGPGLRQTYARANGFLYALDGNGTINILQTTPALANDN